MSNLKTVFLFKENTEDRDGVKYVEISRDFEDFFDCNHYFASLNLVGACCNEFLDIEKINSLDFENLETILTKIEIISLMTYNLQLEELGSGIIKGDERYKQVGIYFETIKPIIDKLFSQENEDLFLKVQEDEKEYLKNEYNWNDGDINDIWDNYYLDYRDRGVIGCVYTNKKEFIRDKAESCGLLKDEAIAKYFNYEDWADDLLNDDNYLELSSGEIVSLNY